MLGEAGKDRSLEIALACLGGGLGFAQNLLKAAHSVLGVGQAPDALDFVLGLACVGLLTVSAVHFKNSKGLSSKIDGLIAEIRARPKIGQPGSGN